jgi:group I intron endonuclease
VSSGKYLAYKITNKLNGKCYIGVSAGRVEARWREHRRCAERGKRGTLYCAMRKWGMAAFTFEVVACAASLADLHETERRLILQYNSRTTGHGYNRTSGGEGTPGRKMTPWNRMRLAAALYRPVTLAGVAYPSRRAACEAFGLSMSSIRKWERTGERPPAYMSPAHKARIGFRKGHSHATRAKLSAWHTGKPSPWKWQAVAVDGVRFPSLRIAAATLGVDRTTIQRWLRAGRAHYA